MSLMDIQAEQSKERRNPITNSNNTASSNNGSSNIRSSDSNRNSDNRNRGGGGGAPPSRRSSGGRDQGGGGGSNFGSRNSNGGGGGGRRNSSNSRRGPDRSSLPLEHGCICSLKEKFGFVHCADRPTEIFFHYSEVTNVNPDDLQVDDEIEFRVGTSRGDNPDKLAAFEIYRLPVGTVKWEYEESPGERYQGLVERPLMRPGGNNSTNNNNRRNSNDRDDGNAEGLLRLLVPASEDKDVEKDTETADKKEADTMTTADGPQIRFTANDYNPDPVDDKTTATEGGDAGASLQRKSSNSSMGNNNNSSNRLFRGDLVEFTLVIEKRTRQKFARNMVVLLSERDRARAAKEKEMMANATLERGVVTSLKQDFGFLRSNARRDEVYFHYPHVVLPEEGEDEHELQIGQDMEFLVLTEDVEDNNNNRGNTSSKQKTSARQVKFLPKGTVQFDEIVAEGITGTVSIVPRADAGRNQSSMDPQSLGSIRLSTALSVTDPKTEETVTVKTASLHVGDAPGGIFSVGRGSSMGLWIRDGDKLLFDVVYDFMDASYHARPTKHLLPVGSPLAEAVVTTPTSAEEKDTVAESEQEGSSGGNEANATEGPDKKKQKNTPAPAVRLIELCLAGRSEGTIHTMKEAYGFIHFSERSVDVHFKQFEMLPDEIQEDLRRNMGLVMPTATKADMMGIHQLTSGTEVQFDLSIQGTVMTQNQHQARGGGGGNKRGGGGQSNQHERENLKAQRMLIVPRGTILQTKTLGLGAKGVITAEDPNQPYAGTLELAEELPQLTLEERHPLIVKMVDAFVQDTDSESLVFHDIQSPKEEDVIADVIEIRAKGKLAMTHIPQAGNSNYAGRLCIKKVSGEPTNKSSKIGTADEQATGAETSETKEGEKAEPEAEVASPLKGQPGRSKSPKQGGGAKKKKALQVKLQPLKTIRYDKSSLTQKAKTEVPAGAGDVIICDVQQIRRTGKVHLENLSATERKVMDASEVATLEGASGVGVVKEVVLASKFGFISVADEAASKRELLFFHFSSVAEQSHGNNNNNYGRNKKGAADAVIHKGDEVKFKIGTEKNGKRVAVDVHIVSSGAVPSKPDKNACKGFILVEPTDTKVGSAERPARNFNRARGNSPPPPPAANGGGRWGNVKMDDNQKDQLRSKGEGVILLLEDPAGMFASAVEKALKLEQGKGKEGEESKEERSKTPTSSNGLGKFHLHYQTGALALHGTGAPTTMDSSTNPRRGDLVSFVKSRGGEGVKDIRVVTRANATLVRGKLGNIDHEKHTAKFVGAVGGEVKEYEINLKEVVSCESKQLKDQIEVEGVLHGDAIHGICRANDLRLETKLGTGKKERPKLNMVVKKDRAGKIMAQSMMATGPDGTMGFAAGWTTRVSKRSSGEAAVKSDE